MLEDYHLRVGQLTQDTRPPAGHALTEQRLDETEACVATAVSLIDAHRPPEWVREARPDTAARWLASRRQTRLGWWSGDVFEAVLTPGDIVLLMSWSDRCRRRRPSTPWWRWPEGGRLRRVRIVRDYGMFDRREAPQYYPEVTAGRMKNRLPPPARRERKSPVERDDVVLRGPLSCLHPRAVHVTDN